MGRLLFYSILFSQRQHGAAVILFYSILTAATWGGGQAAWAPTGGQYDLSTPYPAAQLPKFSPYEVLGDDVPGEGSLNTTIAILGPPIYD